MFGQPLNTVSSVDSQVAKRDLSSVIGTEKGCPDGTRTQWTLII